MTDNIFQPKVIHVGKIPRTRGEPRYFLLKQLDVYRYEWFPYSLKEENGKDYFWEGTVAEALALGYKNWGWEGFELLHCGFRYTLPERDEVGSNALFYQMVSSYSTMTGVYFDEEVGGNCIVQFASQEARLFAKRLMASSTPS